ncbi:MAG: hypothetical protein Q9168_007842 [Polycauliona sp. 1 TL-2023]
MWLINVHTTQLEEVWDEEVKAYAILSHRWQQDEITFKDMQNPEAAANKPQFSKIAGVCEIARNDGYDYAWVDTCCINKDSSAELTEAINSMFRWYKAAAVCYAFLSDIVADSTVRGSANHQIAYSVWFDRGWTLQELLAPANVVFYDHHWKVLGTKQSLRETLMRRTRIAEEALNGEPLSTFSIAQRMSWASQRVTTRKEDIAYSLLGIFDVNMPMLYGEGEKAFIRLQEEIIRQSNDQSIFAWPIRTNDQFSLLATSPVAFTDCNNTRMFPSRTSRATYSIVNGCISGRFQALPYVPDTYIVRLNCTNESVYTSQQRQTCIFLRRLIEDNQYARVRVHDQSIVHKSDPDWTGGARSMSSVDQSYANGRRSTGASIFTDSSGFLSEITVNVRQHKYIPPTNLFEERMNGFCIVTPESEELVTWAPGCRGKMGHILAKGPKQKLWHIEFGFDFSYNPICVVANKHTVSISNGFPFMDDPKPQKPRMFRQRMPGHADDILSEGSPAPDHVFDLITQPGLWVVEGDRFSGKYVCLQSSEQDKQDEAPFMYIRIFREQLHGELIWTIYLKYEDA